MKATRKVLLYVLLTAVGLPLAFFAGLTLWMSWQRHLPSEQTARREFATHAGEYARFVSLLRLAPEDQFIGSDGMVRDRRGASRFVPEYRELMQNLGVQSVLIREDGSAEFELWGFGCAICSDSYMGVRYLPADHDSRPHPGWTAHLVKSLDDKDLLREHGAVADGLYVVPIGPEWFIYRFEYHD